VESTRDISVFLVLDEVLDEKPVARGLRGPQDIINPTERARLFRGIFYGILFSIPLWILIFLIIS
jgi:hypothetical protein